MTETPCTGRGPREGPRACRARLGVARARPALRALVAGLCLLAATPAAGRQSRGRRPAPAPARPQSPAGQGRAAAQQEFDRLAAQASAAREAGDFDRAADLYRKALGLRPRWDEGWWYLGTLLYEQDKYGEAARAFQSVTKLLPKAGAGWAMLALCEFQLGSYDDSLAHLEEVAKVGLADNPELSRSVRYHHGVLMILKGEFEVAQQVLDGLSYEGVNTENVVIALGLAVLRVPALPSQVSPKHPDYELIRRAGWAEHLSAQRNLGEAQREYERLAADYPKAPFVQYAYGRYLLTHRDDDGALAAFKREIENSPENALARLQIAYIKLKNKEAAEGLPYAEEAARLFPRAALGHYILGRLLFDTGQNGRAIEELETAKTLVPDDAKIYFALARAYAKANRKADADRARDTFTRLNQLNEGTNAQGARRGAAIPEEGGDNKPTPP